MINCIKVLMVCLVLGACSPKAHAPALTEEEVLQLVDEKAYQFNLEFVRPQGGRQRLITGNYTFKVQPDQVDSDLPYIGRAFQAPIGATDGGMKFTSKDFEYTATSGKANRREIRIKPRDLNDIQEVFLTVFNNGTAELRINSVNRQMISYTGNITRLPVKK